MNPLPKNRSLYGGMRAVAILVVAMTASRNVNTMSSAFQPPSPQIHTTNRISCCTSSNDYNSDASRNSNRNMNILLPMLQNHRHCRRPTVLFLAAGSRSLNKQAALRQKLEQAKQQNFEQQQQNSTTTTSSSSSGYPFSEQEIRERNDRLRFEELLQKKGGAFIDSENDKEYKTRQQEDDEIDAIRSGRDLLFEGDPAPTDCFEELVSIKTENAIGLPGKQRLVPWLRKNVARQQDYIVLLTDPRMQSLELRETIKVLMSELTNDIKSRLIVINADSPAENRRWLKKVGLFNSISDDSITKPSLTSPVLLQQSQSLTSIQKQQSPPLAPPQTHSLEVYSDEKMEFMRTYTALGDQRWTMTVYIIATERIQKLVRNVDQYTASRTIQNAIQAYKDETKLTIRKKPLE